MGTFSDVYEIISTIVKPKTVTKIKESEVVDNKGTTYYDILDLIETLPKYELERMHKYWDELKLEIERQMLLKG